MFYYYDYVVQGISYTPPILKRTYYIIIALPHGFLLVYTYKSRRLRRDMTAVMLGGEATRRTTVNNITNAAMLQLKRCGIAAFLLCKSNVCRKLHSHYSCNDLVTSIAMATQQ